MMNGIHTIFVGWVGSSCQYPGHHRPIPAIRTEPNLDFWKRSNFQDISQDLILGRLDGLSFCERIVIESETSLKAEDLEDAILRLAVPRRPVMEVLAELSSTYPIWLVSDYPPDWYASISKEFDPYPFIDENRLIFTAACQLNRLIPDLYYLLVQKVNQEMNACMMVTGTSSHSVEAVKHGLTTEIFIDAFRLRRSFVLRKMLPGSDPRSS
jgi:hypothetical protein